jgi:phytoene dehydrogenase-like protein
VSGIAVRRRDVVVVGSGPNGLAAAVTLARAGLDVLVVEAEQTVGGGARSFRFSDDGPLHDLCSAVHPLAAASPFFTEFDLAARGVQFATPPISYGHPLGNETAALAYRDLDRTADGLGADGPRWRSLFGPLIDNRDALLDVILSGRPPGPRLLRAIAPIGALMIQSSRWWNLPWRTESARALLTGVAAHAGSRLPGAVGAGTLSMLGLLAHSPGWPVPIGGSRVITEALEQDLRSHGGTIRTDYRVASLHDLPASRAYLFDTDPLAVAELFGAPRPQVRDDLRRNRSDAIGVTKVDFELSGPVPWTAPELATAGTLHIGGSREEIVRRERAVQAGGGGVGFILASDPTPFDPTRAVPGRQPFWSYAHVRYDSDEDVGDAVQDEIERLAPGFGGLVLHRRTIPAAQMHNHNSNYRGGDITVGMHGLPDFLFGSGRRLPAHGTPRDDVFCCSAATPPGPGVHGMCGYRAARLVLRRRFGISRVPDLGPG